MLASINMFYFSAHFFEIDSITFNLEEVKGELKLQVLDRSRKIGTLKKKVG